MGRALNRWARSQHVDPGKQPGTRGQRPDCSQAPGRGILRQRGPGPGRIKPDPARLEPRPGAITEAGIVGQQLRTFPGSAGIGPAAGDIESNAAPLNAVQHLGQQSKPEARTAESCAAAPR